MSQVIDSSPTVDVNQARQAVRAAGRRYVGQRVAAVLLPALAGVALLAVMGRQWPAAGPALVAMAGLGLALIG